MKPVNSIYIHIPFCISKCHYCDFFSVECKKNNESLIPHEYLAALINELKYKVKKYNIKEIETVYIGGGTPSLLTIKQLDFLITSIQKLIKFKTGYEFTIEMNPDDITEELLVYLNSSIINRISCGIQSLNDSVLKYVNRRAGERENIKALDLFKKIWKKSLSLDLISALPFEKTPDFLKNLSKICDYNPDHISLYSLTIEDETPLGKKLNNGDFEYDFDFADDMWLKGKNLLKEKGYFQYEVSNFAKKGFECKHNLTYWNHNGYLGIGAGATGSIYNDDGSAIRYTNKKNINLYMDFWNKKNIDFEHSATVFEVEEIDVETSKFEYFMMGLRKRSGICKEDFEQTFGCDFPKNVEQLINTWKEKDLCTISGNKNQTFYALSETGLLFLNKFLEEIEL